MSKKIDLSFLKVQFYAFPYRDDNDALRSIGIDPNKKIEPLFDFGTRRRFSADFQRQLADYRFPENTVFESHTQESIHHRRLLLIVDDDFSGSMRLFADSILLARKNLDIGVLMPQSPVIHDEDLHQRTMRGILELLKPDPYKLDMMPLTMHRDALLPELDLDTCFLDDRMERERERKLLHERKVAAFKLKPKGSQR